MSRMPQLTELRAYCALYDVLDTYADLTIHLDVTPNPPRDTPRRSTDIFATTERGANGYLNAHLYIKHNAPDGTHNFGAHGQTIEDAARNMLINHHAAPIPLRTPLNHAAQRAGIRT